MRRKGLHKPRSRIISALLALFMLFGTTTAIVTVTSAGPAKADTLNYPWPTDTQAPCEFGAAGGSSCANPDQTNHPGDKYDWGVYVSGVFHPYRNGYEYRNCTDYVQWKESTVGVSVPSGWGNGGQWYGNAPTSEQSSSPKAWDAAVVPGNPGHVAFVESVNADGTITVSEYNHNVNGTGDYRTGTASTMGFTEFIDFGVHPAGGGSSPPPVASLADGTYVQATDGNKNVYVMAGGSPMLVYSWDDVGGQHSVSYTYTSTQISQQGLMYPRDGTVIRDAKTGALFVVAGGFPFGVTSTTAVPSSYSSSSVYVNVDGNAILHLRSQPADGTSIRDYSNGNPYVISGGAPVYVHDPTTVPYTNWVDIDHWDLANELKPYPTDGSTIIDNYGNVYVMAGGAAMKTMSTNTIPAYSSFAYVDNWTIVNMFPAFPRNGTMVQDYVSQHIYVVAGGSLMLVSSLNNVPYTSWVVISDWSIANEFLQYPEDGTVIQDAVHKTTYVVVGGSPLYITTPNSVPPADMTNAVPIDPNSFTQLLGYPMNGPFVVGYVSGRVYQIQNQTAVYIGNSSLITSTPIPVDDWAITNELHGS